MNRAYRCIFALGLACISWPAAAGLGENRLGAKKLNAEAVEARDIDILITNKHLRAESGSKSTWSLGSALEYSGGNLQKPLAEDRPNIAGTTATTDKALLDGALDVKYNFSLKHSLNAGVGLRWITPLAKNGPKNYDGERVDVANPFLTYQYIYNFAGMESVLQLQSIYYTQSNLTRLGYVSALLLNQDSISQIGDTRFSLGVSAWVQYGIYNKHGAVERTEQADILFGLSPVIEYEFNDVLNLRAVTYLWNFEHLRSQPDFNTYETDRVTQSMGLGVSLSRDVFIYPHVQFVPEDLRAELTNIGISADVSFF